MEMFSCTFVNLIIVKENEHITDSWFYCILQNVSNLWNWVVDGQIKNLSPAKTLYVKQDTNVIN